MKFCCKCSSTCQRQPTPSRLQFSVKNQKLIGGYFVCLYMSEKQQDNQMTIRADKIIESMPVQIDEKITEEKMDKLSIDYDIKGYRYGVQRLIVRPNLNYVDKLILFIIHDGDYYKVNTVQLLSKFGDFELKSKN